MSSSSKNKNKSKNKTLHAFFQPLKLRKDEKPTVPADLPPQLDLDDSHDDSDSDEDMEISLSSLVTLRQQPNATSTNNASRLPSPPEQKKRKSRAHIQSKPQQQQHPQQQQGAKKVKLRNKSSRPNDSVTTTTTATQQTTLGCFVTARVRQEQLILLQDQGDRQESSFTNSNSNSNETKNQASSAANVKGPSKQQQQQPQAQPQGTPLLVTSRTECECQCNCDCGASAQLEEEEEKEEPKTVVSPSSDHHDDDDDDDDTDKPTPTPKPLPLPRRIYSDSTMEFCPDLSTKRPCTVLDRLVHRTTHGSRLRMPSPTPPKWKTPSWIRLGQQQQQSQQPNGGAGRDAKVEHLAWDRTGVLLAVASADKYLRIYDWDMVRAADLKGRGDRQRRIQDSKWTLPPILIFRVPHAVATLKWNPHKNTNHNNDDYDNEDQLAVGFKATATVHLYQVDRISMWLSSKSSTSPPTALPPKRTYTALFYPRSCGTASSVEFLDTNTILVNLGNLVYCWKLQLLLSSSSSSTSSTSSSDKKKNKKIKKSISSRLQWRYHPPSTVTCTSTLGSSLVLLGTERGTLCLLDWTKTTPERAFSSQHRPIVVQAWTPYKSSDHDMGMVQFKIDQATNHNTTSTSTATATTPTLLQKAAEYDPWGHVRISWVTVSGWLLSTVMESPTLRGDCQVLHTPPKVEYRTADGTVLDTTTTTTTSGNNNNITKAKRAKTTTKAYSLPQDPMRADTTTASSQLMIWSDVPAVTKILPHHNKYVLDAQPTVTRPNQRALLMRNLQQEGSSTNSNRTSTSSRTQSIPLLAAKTPQAIAVHPGLEWMVLGVDHRLVLMVGRRQ